MVTLFACLVINTLTCIVQGGQFLGGSMSFETEWNNGKSNVTLMLLSGWTLGDGPCGQGCSEDDIGNSTTSEWQSIPMTKGNINYFGQFIKDTERSSGRHPVVPSQRKDMLQLANRKSNWEMESSVMTFVVDETSDIIYEGHSYIPFSNDVTRSDSNFNSSLSHSWHMQVKIDVARRIIDRQPGPPNSSPVVLTKPYYEFGTDKDFSVRLPVIDFDGDKWRCRKAFYQESGTFLSAYQRSMSNHMFDQFHSISKEDCKVYIKSSKMREGDTGVVAVTVTDMLKKVTEFENKGLRGSGEILSAVSIQFYYRIKENVSNPFFLTPPTPSINQVYVIYVGAKFTVDVYASTNHSMRTIKSIDFLRRDTKYVTRIGMRPANIPNHPKAMIETAIWEPTVGEIGKHIMCANVKDSAGVDSVDMQCFIIEIREAIKDNPGPSVSGPTFVNFPSQEELLCHVNAFCRFPIYATTDTPGGIKHIDGSSDEVTHLTVTNRDNPVSVQLNNHQVWRSEIQYFANLPGIKSICMKALDSKYLVQQCVKVKVNGQDPCAKDPCGKNARCINDEDLIHFECVCNEGFKGEFCNETVVKVKATDGFKCFNGGTKSSLGPFCICPAEYTTDNCVHAISKCPSSNCAELCDQQDIFFTCKKVKHQTEQCTPKCGANAICKNGQCRCPIGFGGPPICDKAEGKTGSFKSQFVPPTPSMGSEVACDTRERTCIFPVYMESNYLPNVTAEMKGTVIGLPHLTIDISTPIQTGIKGMANVYRADVNFNKNDIFMPPLHNYNLCLFLCNTDGSKCPDYRCLVVSYIPKPIWKQKKKMDFIAPTPPEESVLSCVVNKPCHFFVYTETATPGYCMPVLSDIESSVGIFPADIVDGNCQTDVTYLNNTHPNKGRVCLKSRTDGISRCFWMVVTDDNDECKSNAQICKNDGLCQPFANGTSLCHCPDKYSGKHCEVGPCSTTICNNNGECYDTGTKKMCFCKLGFSGHHCKTHNTDVTNSLSATFKDHTYTTTINCYVERSCFIPYIISAKSGSRPIVAPGFHSTDIDFKSAQINEDQDSHGKFHTNVEVIGHVKGNQKRFCIKTRGEIGTTNDETCVYINVLKGPAPIPDKIKPYFVKPTLSDNSKVECKVGSPCRMNLWVSNDEFLSTCPEVQSNKGPSDGVYVIQQPNENSPCRMEAVFKTDHAQRYNVCFTPYTPKHSIAGGAGTSRCYNLDITTNLTALSPCNYKHCQHGGFCNTESGQADCLCMAGYSGETCQIEQATPQNGPSNGFGDMVQIKTVSCYINTECPLPFSFNEPRPSLSVNVGAQDGGLEIKSAPSKTLTRLSAGTYLGIITVIPIVKKTHTLCLQKLQGTSQVLEEYCFRILTLNKGKMKNMADDIALTSAGSLTDTLAKSNPMQPHFSPPTLPTNSEVYCIPGKTCHILMSISAGSHNECPNLQRNIGDPSILHVFHSNTDKEVVGSCAADLALSPPVSKAGNETYCFTAVLPQHGIVGERRCVNVHFDKPVSTRCQQHQCDHQGVCIAPPSNQVQSPECLCSIGKLGQNCNKEGITIQTKHGSLTASAPEAVFVETVIPKSIPCKVNEPCGIPLLISGPKSKITLCGTDSSIKMEQRVEEITSLKMYLVTVKLTPKSTGVQTVCVQTSLTPKDSQEICFFINTTIRGQTNGQKGQTIIKDPTTPDGSFFECESGSSCHVILHTTISSGQCNTVSQASYPKSTRIVGYSKLTHGECLTDIATHCEDGKELKIICLWEDENSANSNQRCFHVQCIDKITPLTDQCPNPTTEASTTVMPTTLMSTEMSTTSESSTTLLVSKSTSTMTPTTESMTTTPKAYSVVSSDAPKSTVNPTQQPITTTKSTVNPTQQPITTTKSTVNPTQQPITTTTKQVSSDLSTHSKVSLNQKSTTANPNGNKANSMTINDLTTKSTGTISMHPNSKMNSIVKTNTDGNSGNSAKTPSTTGQPSQKASSKMSSLTGTNGQTTNSMNAQSSAPSISVKSPTTENPSVTPSLTNKLSKSPTATDVSGTSSTSDSTSTTLSVITNQPNVQTSGCSALTPDMAREAARNGRVQCTCYVNGQTKQVITLKPKVTNAQLLRAAGISAGSMTGAMAIATIIYIVVSKIISAKSSKAYHNSRKQKPCKRNW